MCFYSQSYAYPGQTITVKRENTFGVPSNTAYGTIMSATETVAGTQSGTALITSAPTGTDASSSGKGTNTKSEATSNTASGNGVVNTASPMSLLGSMFAALLQL
jgi:hypothetical protein